MNTNLTSTNIPSRPMPLLRTIVSLILCPLIALTPVATFAAESKSRATGIPTFELADQTFHGAVLVINSGDLMVLHDGGIYRHKLSNMYFKTLQRIGDLKPLLRESPEYRAALATFVPRMTINGRVATGVRLQDATYDSATFLTDGGIVSCQWSDLDSADRAQFAASKAGFAAANAEQARQQRLIEEAQATAARNAAAERERVRVAQQEAMERQARQAQAAKDDDDTATVVAGAVVVGGLLWLGSKIFGGDDAPATSPQRSRQDDLTTEFANRARRERDEQNQRAAEQRDRDAAERQRRQWAAEAEAAAQRRAQ